MYKFAVIVAAALLVAGCSSLFGSKSSTPMYTTMGEKAPKYADSGSWPTFIVGMWSEEQYAEPTEVKNYYNFTSDGMFTCLHAGYKLGGKWTVSADSIALSYDTLNGKPLYEEMERIKKGAESGRQTAIANDIFADWVVNATTKRIQISLSEDTKELQWGPPIAASQPQNGETPDFSAMMQNMAPNMMRLQESK